MSGERDPRTLRSHMSPSLHEEPFVYCCLAENNMPASLRAMGTFREAEGLTAIVLKAHALELGLTFEFVGALITLNVHSSLDAVGFIAMVSAALAKERIPCNVVSAYYHDHLFVPFDERHRAMQVLCALSAAD